MGEGASTSPDIAQPAKAETRPTSAITEARLHAGALTASMQEATKQGIADADPFLAELKALQDKYPHLFPAQSPPSATIGEVRAQIDELTSPQGEANAADQPTSTPTTTLSKDVTTPETSTKLATAESAARPEIHLDSFETINQQIKKLQITIDAIPKRRLSDPHFFDDYDRLSNLRTLYDELKRLEFHSYGKRPEDFEERRRDLEARIRNLDDESSGENTQAKLKTSESPTINAQTSQAPEGRLINNIVETNNPSLALVRQAIKYTVSSDEQTYVQDYLRSPQITEETIAHALPDASQIIMDNSEYHGKGLTSTVFKGRARGGVAGLRGMTSTSEELPIVVKVPQVDSRTTLDDASARNLLTTIEEAYVLDSIRQTQRRLYPGTKPFVPDSVLIQNYRGAPALALEYMDSANDIYNDKLTLQQLKSASVQYFQLQNVIHTAGFTCNDVKGGDLFYEADQDRLVVLDWNITKPNSSPLTHENIKAMNGDFLTGLQLFGVDRRNRWTPEALVVFRSLEQRVQSQRTTAPFDAAEIIKELKALPV